jgi:hypothetical protein
VTGKLSFEDWPCPEITSKGKTYELMIPIHYARSGEVEAGETVTVEGYPVEKGWHGHNRQYIKVTKVVIDEKEYDLTAPHRLHLDRWRGDKMPLVPQGKDRK